MDAWRHQPLGLNWPCPVEASQKLLGSPRQCLGLWVEGDTPQFHSLGWGGEGVWTLGGLWGGLVVIPVPSPGFSLVSLLAARPPPQRALPDPSRTAQEGSREALWNNWGDALGGFITSKRPQKGLMPKQFNCRWDGWSHFTAWGGFQLTFAIKHFMGKKQNGSKFECKNKQYSGVLYH